MKLITFEVKTSVGPVYRIGALKGQQIVDLQAVYASYLREVRDVWRWRELAKAMVPPDMIKFIEGGVMAKEAAQVALNYFEDLAGQVGQDGEKFVYQAGEVKLMAPVPQPISIRDCSAFLQHSRNMTGMEKLPQQFYETPVHYRGSSTDVVGPDAPILWPSYTEQLDYELEFAICIGKYGVNIPPEKAEEYIFGYTLFNDISARDILPKEMGLFGPSKGKSFQNSNIMGPCLVTPDEIDPKNLKMVARINGEVWSEGNSRDMHFKFPQLIAYLSKDDPLYPGEFIGSGTVGFGCGRELNRWLKPGDVVELEAEGIGILRNKVERNSGKLCNLADVVKLSL
jgi:2-keto-4-pentenoate hydratase/2-oxohepta-3-ene-1,7-dioic acid hydratase in catechol pathway